KKAPNGQRTARRARALRGRVDRRLPQSPGQGRRPNARAGGKGEGAAAERARRDGRAPEGPGTGQQERPDRRSPRQARPAPPLRRLLRAPQPDPAAEGTAAALRPAPRRGHAVRPLKLQLEGFTSFKEKLELDFSGLDLFAITGPTGAGKSSLIDAIVF